ncbi:MAG: hypothetical protein AAFO89_13370, partial [Planctomycetota bacterium]
MQVSTIHAIRAAAARMRASVVYGAQTRGFVRVRGRHGLIGGPGLVEDLDRLSDERLAEVF